MKKNNVFVILIIVFIFIIIGIGSNKLLGKKDNVQPVKTQSDKNAVDNVPILREEYLPTFTKDNKLFSSESIEVPKKQYTGNLFVILSGDNVNGNFRVKLYDNKTVIYDGKFDGYGITIPYKLKNEKGTFRLEVSCTADLKDENTITPSIVWYLNKAV